MTSDTRGSQISSYLWYRHVAEIQLSMCEMRQKIGASRRDALTAEVHGRVNTSE